MVTGQLQASAALFPSNEHPAFTEKEGGCAPQSIRTLEKKNFLILLPGVEPQFFGRPIRCRYYTDSYPAQLQK
jgi:hypothetical protein